MKFSHREGFTLIELLVVIAIISLLSSVVLASVNLARAKARDVKRLSDVHQLQLALEGYRNAHNAYPSTGGSYQILAGGSTALQVLVTEGFIAKIPSDPQSTSAGPTCPPPSFICLNNEYYYGSPGWWDVSWPYQIQFQLENRNDGVGTCNGGICPSMWGDKYMYSAHF